MIKTEGQKSTKNHLKMTSHKMIKKWLKIDFHGGGQKLIKIDKFRPRGPGPPKTEFFEILQFSTKAPPLFDPKIDPYK
jgi:hypothetical protein